MTDTEATAAEEQLEDSIETNADASKLKVTPAPESLDILLIRAAFDATLARRESVCF